MRGLSARLAAPVLAALGACGAEAQPTDLARYLREPAFRRAALVDSLVSAQNDYARLRLARYDSGDAQDWSRLPEWNPAVAPVRAAELDAPRGVDPYAQPGPEAAPLALTEPARAGDPAALRALGALAFTRYPAQLAPAALPYALDARASAARYGLWTHDSQGLGGLVRVRFVDGSAGLALTCASCHAAVREDGSLALGAPNARLDLGALAADGAPAETEVTARLRAFGPGRVDVTTADAREPVALPDLRPVRFLTHLHRDATVRQRDLVSLAVRLETLLLTSHHGTVRPPREVSLGLALYLWSLAEELPSLERASASQPAGRALFDARCAACHEPPGLTGAPVPLATVGTDPSLGLSADRGTGTYRVPSLHGVGTRGPLLHDGAAPSLAVLFDPARTSADYALRARAPGAIPGHLYALDLTPEERAALLAFLSLL